jgi:hypothetical protein
VAAENLERKDIDHSPDNIERLVGNYQPFLFAPNLQPETQISRYDII